MHNNGFTDAFNINSLAHDGDWFVSRGHLCFVDVLNEVKEGSCPSRGAMLRPTNVVEHTNLHHCLGRGVALWVWLVLGHLQLLYDIVSGSFLGDQLHSYFPIHLTVTFMLWQEGAACLLNMIIIVNSY